MTQHQPPAPGLQAFEYITVICHNPLCRFLLCFQNCRDGSSRRSAVELWAEQHLNKWIHHFFSRQKPVCLLRGTIFCSPITQECHRAVFLSLCCSHRRLMTELITWTVVILSNMLTMRPLQFFKMTRLSTEASLTAFIISAMKIN